MQLYALPNNYVKDGIVEIHMLDNNVVYLKGTILTTDKFHHFNERMMLPEKVLLSRSYSVRASKHVLKNYLVHVKQVGCASVKADFSRFDGMIYGDVLLDTRDIKIGIFRIDLFLHEKDGNDKKIRLTQDKQKAK